MKKLKSKVNIRYSEGGYLIEITNTPFDQTYAVTKPELAQIILLGGRALASERMK